MIIVITLIGALVWYSWSVLSFEVSCYDVAKQAGDTIQFRTVASQWGKRQVCEAQYAKLDALNTCLVKINDIKINSLQKYLDPYFKQIFRLVRPTYKFYRDQKADYDTSCAEFGDILIP